MGGSWASAWLFNAGSRSSGFVPELEQVAAAWRPAMVSVEEDRIVYRREDRNRKDQHI
jgi:hypothetical protein